MSQSENERADARAELIARGHTIHLRFYITGHGFSTHPDHADCGLHDAVTTDRPSEVTCSECIRRIEHAVGHALERGTI